MVVGEVLDDVGLGEGVEAEEPEAVGGAEGYVAPALVVDVGMMDVERVARVVETEDEGVLVVEVLHVEQIGLNGPEEALVHDIDGASLECVDGAELPEAVELAVVRHVDVAGEEQGCNGCQGDVCQ